MVLFEEMNEALPQTTQTREQPEGLFTVLERDNTQFCDDAFAQRFNV